MRLTWDGDEVMARRQAGLCERCGKPGVGLFHRNPCWEGFYEPDYEELLGANSRCAECSRGWVPDATIEQARREHRELVSNRCRACREPGQFPQDFYGLHICPTCWPRRAREPRLV